MRAGSYDLNSASVKAMLNQHNQSFVANTTAANFNTNNSTHVSAGTHHKKKSVGGGGGNTISNKNLINQKYLSAGSTQMGNFSLQGTSHAVGGMNPHSHSSMGHRMDHHSFDHGIKHSQRPNSQMSNY